MQATRARWRNLQRESEPTPQLEQAAAAFSPLVTQIIHNRGIGPDEVAEFLAPHRAPDHDPFLLSGMRVAIDRLLLARARGEIVAVHGDFDVDGITGTAVLMQALTLAGLRAAPHIPDRQSEGAGLHARMAPAIAALGAGLVLTVDCGISSVEGVTALRDAGIDVIVTDHHCPPPVLPAAVSIVDPLLPHCAYPFKHLAGVGVAFKVAQALLAAVGRPAAETRQLFDLVAIGTIADMAPLVGENRGLVWHGMRVLNDTGRGGLQALIARSGLRPGAITSTDVAYRLCPRLNAAGRLDHASLGYELLIADSYEEADVLAQRLEEKNAERQVLTQQALQTARAAIARQSEAEHARLLMIEIEPWAACVMGLLAGKLVEEYGKPTVVWHLADNEARGSVRGTPAFDVHAALRANADLLERFGGHRLAAGFTTRRAHIQSLDERLRRQAETALTAADVVPTLCIDAELAPRQIAWDLLDQLQALEPCGIGNPLPLFLCRNMEVQDFRRVGNNHLRLVLGRGGRRQPAIVFRRGDLMPYLRRHMTIDLVFHLEMNEWNGGRVLQLRVRDLAFASGE